MSINDEENDEMNISVYNGDENNNENERILYINKRNRRRELNNEVLM